MAKIHACSEVRVGVWARTFCGLEIRQRADRVRWETRAWRLVEATRDKASVTCGSCWRGMD